VGNETKSLKEMFPELPFVEEADKFLAVIVTEKLSLIDQLKRRSIGRVRSHHGVCDGYCGIEENKFLIAVNNWKPLDVQIITLGHEIGHTFHLDLISTDPFHLFPYIKEDKGLSYKVEDFCEAFAKIWKDIQSQKEVMEFLSSISKIQEFQL
jgi:hypothetical protein